MFPASVTITSTLVSAGQVVNEYSGLIGIVLGFAFGIFAIGFGIAKVKQARS